MACGSCAKRRKKKVTDVSRELFGEYKYLSNKQIEARLSSFKRKYCKECDDKYTCNYAMYLKCKGGK